ncbi:hypothetical protein M9Y10_003769 [Tritrichomonas musculus]|uniref:Protein kinase domain-containing protein n=1 Tax=Tritrichomonas musculus TaxID=1915356 RepID=A0ABR2JS51_9EUKA
MSTIFMQINEQLKKGSIKVKNAKMNQIIRSYAFFDILKDSNLKIINQISQKLNKSEIIIINQYKEANCSKLPCYLIISFKNAVIFLKKTDLSFFCSLLSEKSDLTICFLSNTKDIFDEYISIKYKEMNFSNFNEELFNFNKELSFKNLKNANLKLWNCIKQCIALYLFAESYIKSNKNRIKTFISNRKVSNSLKTMKKDDFIQLKCVGKGSTFFANLCYHIDLEELFVIKCPLDRFNIKNNELMNREINNYQSIINHPFLPLLGGVIQDLNFPVIEFINGHTLYNLIKTHSVDDKLKINIIFQLMIIIEFLHRNHFILRDNKPNNIMIDQNGTVVIIDFDRIIFHEGNIEDEIKTQDFSSIYIAPELNSSNFSYECDIYSLGKIIYFIMNGENPKARCFEDHSIIKKIYEDCIKQNPKERPSLIDLIIDFYVNYHSQIEIDDLCEVYEKHFNKLYEINFFKILKDIGNESTISDALNELGILFKEGKFVKPDINKAIQYFSMSAERKNSKSLINLGNLYYEGEFVTRDINKGIQYYSLAANQNDAKAQLKLGRIYSNGEYVKIDINKAIHYLTLSAKQNEPKAQERLGIIYYEGKYIKHDINKAIQYFLQAANQNLPYSLFALGEIYDKAIFVERDINKAINYYTLASNQNFSSAQCNLGVIFYQGKYVALDIQKAIHYLTLAANNNNVYAQMNLGCIYDEGKYVVRDIPRAIHYFTMAANQNNSEAQVNLGFIYYNSSNDCVDYNKAIHYFSLAAEQDNFTAQYNLGIIYEEGKCVFRDIMKAIHYYSLASNHYYANAQYRLGCIYMIGNHVPKDVEKGIYYLSLAANQNHPYAQFNLANIYSRGEYVQINMNKAFYLFDQSAKKGIHQAHFALGFLYQQGQVVKKDISKSIYHYKYASSLGNLCAKNNLAIIYKLGIEGEIDKNLNLAVEYLEEVIKTKNDNVALFNLASIYIYDIPNEENIFKSIDLLIRTEMVNFINSKILLSVLMFKYCGSSLENIKKEIDKHKINNNPYLANELFDFGIGMNLNNESILMATYLFYQYQNILYNHLTKKTLSVKYFNIKNFKIVFTDRNEKVNHYQCIDINDLFYEGFELDVN